MTTLACDQEQYEVLVQGDCARVPDDRTEEHFRTPQNSCKYGAQLTSASTSSSKHYASRAYRRLGRRCGIEASGVTVNAR